MVYKSNFRYCLVVSVLLLLILCSLAVGKIIYVDDDATGANNVSTCATSSDGKQMPVIH
jgi:hypothetical protein